MPLCYMHLLESKWMPRGYVVPTQEPLDRMGWEGQGQWRILCRAPRRACFLGLRPLGKSWAAVFLQLPGAAN